MLVADPVEGSWWSPTIGFWDYPVDPEPVDVGWQYRVEQSGLNEQPQAGVLISGGEAGISGRVVSVDQTDERPL